MELDKLIVTRPSPSPSWRARHINSFGTYFHYEHFIVQNKLNYRSIIICMQLFILIMLIKLSNP